MLNSSCGARVSATTYLGEFYIDKNRAKYFTLASAITTMAFMAQSVLAAVIIPLDFSWDLFGWMIFRSWRLYMLAGSCFSGIGWLGITWLPESPKYVLIMGNQQKSLHILRRIYSANTKRPETVIKKTYLMTLWF